MPPAPAILPKIAFMLVSGLSEESILATATEKLGASKRAARRALREARARLIIAANYDRDEALGAAIARLSDCYAKSMAISDIKTAVQTQRELNRLLRLYEPRFSLDDLDPAASTPDPELAAVRQHLEPLGLGQGNEPAAELARLAAVEIIRLRSRS